MALTQITGSPFRIDAFVTALRAAGWSAGPATAHFDVDTNDISTGNYFWYPRLDRFYSIAQNDPGQDDFLWWDPLVLDATSPASGYIDNANHPRGNIFAIGEWDKVLNTQRVYAAVNSGNNELIEVDAVGATFTLTNLSGGWPFNSAASGLQASTGIPAGTIGSRTAGQGEMVLFETWGFGLLTNITVRHTDNIQYANVMAVVDLSTGSSTIDPLLPITYRSTSPHQFENPSAFGNSFTLDHVQFIPDEDSTLAQPKGLLYFSTIDSATDLRTGTNPGAICKCYVRFNDFNPFSKTAAPGTPNRVHGREVLFSRFELTEQTEPESGGIGTFTSGNKLHQTVSHFHVPSQKVLGFYETESNGNDNVLVQHALSPILDSLTEPTQRRAPAETGRTLTFEVSAFGNLGEPIANLSLDWSLKRSSTFEEVLDTSAQGPTVTLANVPVDTSGILDVRLLGVLLVESTDYTVVRSTGIVTWIGPQSPPAAVGYTATYAHSATPVSPSHGKLLNTNSKTDGVGRAVARVQIDDNANLVGMIDFIDRAQSAL